MALFPHHFSHAHPPQKSTPLHLASEKGRVEAVKVLLEAGADKDVKNVRGIRPCILKAWQRWLYSNFDHVNVDPRAIKNYFQILVKGQNECQLLVLSMQITWDKHLCSFQLLSSSPLSSDLVENVTVWLILWLHPSSRFPPSLAKQGVSSTSPWRQHESSNQPAKSLKLWILCSKLKTRKNSSRIGWQWFASLLHIVFSSSSLHSESPLFSGSANADLAFWRFLDLRYCPKWQKVISAISTKTTHKKTPEWSEAVWLYPSRSCTRIEPLQTSIAFACCLHERDSNRLDLDTWPRSSVCTCKFVRG